MTTPLPIDQAAHALGIGVSTLHGWIARGCPASRRGCRGRGHETLVNLAEVRAWRDARDNPQTQAPIATSEVSQLIATAVWQAFVDFDGPGKRAFAEPLATAWQRAAIALTARLGCAPITTVPAEILRLLRILDEARRLDLEYHRDDT